MDRLVYITHELEGKEVRYYDASTKLFLKNKLSDFVEISNMSVEKWANGRKIVRVEGIVRLYGYKVEGGGFFDLLNLRYYGEFSSLVQNSQIKSISGECNLSKVKKKR